MRAEELGKRHYPSISFIIATKDRPEELRSMLSSVAASSIRPHEIVIVDGGKEELRPILREFRTLRISHIRCIPPSAARQRNLGIRAAAKSSEFLAFFDDDTVIQREALERMLEFWKTAKHNVGGAGFNMINHPPLLARTIKSWRIIEWLGLYSSKPGWVMPSGFHTMIGKVNRLTRVHWLPSTAVVFRREVVTEHGFDEWFGGYSYLEDLDFSYSLGKEFELVIVPGAAYFHYPAPEGRGNGFVFGYREFVNRFYFVKKNPELSIPRCFLGMVVRGILSFFSATRLPRTYQWQRVAGNFWGLASLILRLSRSSTK